MDRLVNAIIEKLKTGSIKNVVLFSDQDKFPEPPYAVVKPEAGVIDNTRTYRIIAYHTQGNADILEDYVLKELDALLAGSIEDKDGGRYKLYPNGFTDITPSPTDSSYFMERLYYTPLLLRS
jgi:hypothetical protein